MNSQDSETRRSPAPVRVDVATEGHAIRPTTERLMAKRAHALTVEVRSSHVAMLSHPEGVTRLILDGPRSAG